MVFISTGYIRVYTGKGQGKTTSSFGAGLRAVGAGYKVKMVQFLKSREDSGLKALKRFDNFSVDRFGREGKLKGETLPIDYEQAGEALEVARNVVENSGCRLLILDEVNVALDQGLIEVSDLIDLLENKPDEMEVILTGRYAPDEVIEVADLVTVMDPVKHYMKSGVKARKGFDY
ncbi:cob(I)yrinic acid a,c-diamide adenosyltransferase [Methanonatronarchaeum sp. AMET-Sl]|uniref:cob(I)yrinic acid a,c-diamide adenosyltransferase n=1 Tax=Methanonatronarchaeum sp. AMET-Sl TaxID=3037654 RepID=UPI00244DB738|nr:cob(I)yrinic acid a,c-diamide adenosyltransferase [Methanonatronarchaeum sp. AMET-Sl]WGI17798.1 cob(I)yrinic acid a,c-diamide adenosyltransferase [Methanonatronarchaeum sp. AMET-Sl]